MRCCPVRTYLSTDIGCTAIMIVKKWQFADRASLRGQERNQIQPLRFDRLITSVCNATKDQLKAMTEFKYSTD